MNKKSQCYDPEVWGGIECTINRVKDNYFDQLSYSDYYNHPQHEEISQLGIKKLRFPVLWEKHQPSNDAEINWDWTERQLLFFREKEIDVIAGLVHHGSGPSFTNLLDPEFPYLLAKYAGQVAKKFPWLEYYTPVNEPLTTARFSALYGLWYPHEKNDRSFLKALLHQVKAIVLSMKEIRKINPNAKLVQTEDLGKTYSTPLLQYQADFENERRWLSYDLLLGKVTEEHKLWSYILKHGITEKELAFFSENICVPDIAGFNHYVTSERYLDERTHLYAPHTHGSNGKHHYADVEVVRVEVEEETGLQVLLHEAWERYKIPIAITEAHLHCHREEQLRWFSYVWNTCKKSKQEGVNILAVTAWAILGSYGWDRLLTIPNGTYEPGVFDLRSGRARRTALTSFIENVAKNNTCDHYLSNVEGWWQRNNRFFIPSLINEENNFSEKLKKTQPLLIIGKRGTLGKAFAKICEHRAIHYHLLSREDCDISNIETIRGVIQQYHPWGIVNAAGYVKVDEAEMDEDKCLRDNHLGPLNLARVCKEMHVHLATFSSDLVFDGNNTKPYVESDKVNPLNVYGKSKALSEKQVLKENEKALVIRTSAFFGPWDQYNFLHWVEESLSKGKSIEVASDVYISPTYVPDLVHATLDLMIDGESGIWHLANKGCITWAELAIEAARRNELDMSLIKPLPLKKLNYSAPRPYYSVLGTERGYLLPDLENAINRYFIEKEVTIIA